MAKKRDPREDNLLLPDLATAIHEFKNGKPIGETARIPVVTEQYSWKRGFVNCWTGWPNDGKSTFLMFMMLVKSICDGWRWCVWSPEMFNAQLDDKKKVILSAGDIIDELVFMKTGLTPYKHFKPMFGVPQMPEDVYVDAWQWVNEHFYFVNVKDRKYNSLLDTFRFYNDMYNFHGFVLDPWKNVDDSGESGRQDQFLKNAFADIKSFSLETNSSFNIVAHPRSDKDPKNPDGSYKVCTQFMLSGGSEWNNSMDGIYSIHRPFKHRDPQDRRVAFFNLKQRKQQLVGRVGVYSKIEFDFKSNRYFFDSHCPIDGSFLESIDSIERRHKAAKAEEKKHEPKPEKKKKAEPGEGTEDISFADVTVDMSNSDDKPVF